MVSGWLKSEGATHLHWTPTWVASVGNFKVLSRLFEMKIASLPFDLQMLLRQQANRLLSPFAPLDSA
jgi:hypothetical protein